MSAPTVPVMEVAVNLVGDIVVAFPPSVLEISSPLR